MTDHLTFQGLPYPRAMRSGPRPVRLTSARDIPTADRYAGSACTLGGHPAIITGRLDRFATVRTFPTSDVVAVFAWPTVARIMAEHGGAFGIEC